MLRLPGGLQVEPGEGSALPEGWSPLRFHRCGFALHPATLVGVLLALVACSTPAAAGTALGLAGTTVPEVLAGDPATAIGPVVGALGSVAPLILVLSMIPSPGWGLTRLFTRREAIVGAAVLLAILVIGGLLVASMVTLGDAGTGPENPSELEDEDGDEVPDVVEVFVYGSNPRKVDTSGDGVPDGWKARHSRWDPTYNVYRPSPARNDTNQRLEPGALTVGEAYERGTDPRVSDTSGDGFTDAWLVRSGLDPQDKHDPEEVCAPDGMTIEEKYELDLLACARDSSGNGLPDQAAIEGRWVVDGRTITFQPTDPSNWSTGGSGTPDGWILRYDLDPHDPGHRTSDPDDDHLSTLQEWQYSREQCGLEEALSGCGLDPTGGDTDGDGIPDGWEVRRGLDPLDPDDASDDPDGDGLTSGREFEQGTDPTSADTDRDTLEDGREVRGWTIAVDGDQTSVQSNPLMPETDGDGLNDSEESRGRTVVDGTSITFEPTNPMSADTDADGLRDRRELVALPSPHRLDPTTSDTSESGLLDGEEWDLWTGKADRARVDDGYAGLVAGERGVSDSRAADLLGPGGDLDSDGVPNVLQADVDGDGLRDGDEVSPGFRSGRQLPASDPALEDSDGDDLPDAWELQHTQYSTDVGGWLLDPLESDSDGDGVPDGDEDYESGCFDDRDAGGDGIPWEDRPFPNRLELEHGSKPLECDTDDDGLPDGWEVFSSQRLQTNGIQLSLNPLVADSEGDGVRDGARVSPVAYEGQGRVNVVGQDPRCPERGGKVVCLWRWGTPDAPLASRFGDLGDLVELRGPCEPGDRCTVVLEVNLSTEVSSRTNPAAWDTSGDGFQDAWKLLHRFDPTDATVPRPADDPDGDGLSTWEEYRTGTDPLDADTDQGGVPDGVDIDPLDPQDDTGDCDWDGIDDREEAVSGGTRPGTPDTSGDGLLDGSYNPGGCVTAQGPQRPAVGEDIVAVPGETDDGGFTLVGSSDAGTDAGAWDTSGDGLPDGWKVLYDLNPLVPDSPEVDLDSDDVPLRTEYQLGRPAWWDEEVHGAWWYGSSPRTTNTRDLDGDGLDDTFFDPEPLSPSNDCSLPDHWELPPAWSARGRAFCLASTPAEDQLETFLAGLRQLAYPHVLNATEDPEGERRASEQAGRTTVRATSFEVDEVIETARPFNVSLDLCHPEGDSCVQPEDVPPPPVGIYASNRSQGAQPDPREDVLLCVLSPDPDWSASGTCSLAPGTRSNVTEDEGLVLAPHRHGFVEPGEGWRVEPGDVRPGRQLRLTAWPLPARTNGLVAPEVDLSSSPPPEKTRTPGAQATVELPSPPRFERGEPQNVLLQLAGDGGHPLPDYRLEATWRGQDLGSHQAADDGTVALELDPGEPDDPRRAWLNVTLPSLGGVDGTSAAFDLPIRVPTTLAADPSDGRVPGSLTVDVGLTDHEGEPVPGQPVEARLAQGGGSGANATTGGGGNATVDVPLPGGTQPGQRLVQVGFSGTDRWGPSSWEGTAEVRVQPNLTVDVPDEVLVTEGTAVEVGLRLPSGDVLVPAPGDPLNLSVSVAGVSERLTVTDPPSGGNVTVPIPASAGLSLGNQPVEVRVGSDRFVEATSTTDAVRVVTPATARVSPKTLGAGANNSLAVDVRGTQGGGLPDVPVEVQLGDARASGVTGSRGTARLTLPLGVNVSRGEHTLALRAEETNASRPLETEVPVQVLTGTVLQVPDVVNGSVDELSVSGRLVLPGGQPVSDAPIQVQAFGEHETRTQAGGGFSVDVEPPDGTAPGRYQARLSYEGGEGLAPSSRSVDLALAQPTRVEVDEIPPTSVGGDVQVTGRVLAGNESVDAGTVQVRVQDVQRNASVGDDGRFRASLPLEGAEPGNHTVEVTYDPGPGYGGSRASAALTLVHDVRLHLTHRVSSDRIHFSVQAVRADGSPLPDARILLETPGSPILVRTDDHGVAQASFTSDVLPEGSEVEAVYRGDETHASAQVATQVPASGTPTPDRSTILALVLGALVAVEGYLLWRVYRRRRVVEEVLEAVDDFERELKVGDEHRAVVLSTYHRLRQALESVGWEEDPHQTHREFLQTVFDRAGVPTRHLGPFVDLVDRAQYDPTTFDPGERARALRLANRLREDLVATLGREGVGA